MSNLPTYKGNYTPTTRAFDYTGEVVNRFTGEVTRPPSRTKQEFVSECDINNIIASYRLTGQIAHINSKAAQGVYADLPDSLDYQSSLNTILQAQASFASLPSAVRDRFGNDPSAFLAFMADPQNEQEARKLGLLNPSRGGDGGNPPPSSTSSSGQIPAAEGSSGKPTAQ